MPSPSGSTPIFGFPYLEETDPPDVATASEDLATAVEDVIGVAWVSYTPSWTASGTNPTLGNGTLIGKYRKIGKTVDFRIYILGGSTTDGGSGDYTLSLPAEAVADGSDQIVPAWAQNGAGNWTGFASFGSSETAFTATLVGDGDATPVGFSNIHVGNGSIFVAQGTYEAN